MSPEPQVVGRLDGFGTSIFAEMTSLAIAHRAVNLGQGFPDFDGPDFVKRAAIDAIEAGRNQYSPMPGVPDLAAAIAEHQRRYYGLDYRAADEITIHAGATEAICAALLALLRPGDELIVCEPYYDSYPAVAALSGATMRCIPLLPPDFAFDAFRLERAITSRTRALLLNTPNNPTGKVFAKAELEIVADLCRRHNLIAITDEVYEHIVFDGAHHALAAWPGMRERTVAISSTGKTFSLTGWKIGYTCAPPALTQAIRAVHQFVTFCVATPLQYAMAAALRAGDEYFCALRTAYHARRERLCLGLEAAGFDVLRPQGTYFALADIRPLSDISSDRFCRLLPEKLGVAAIPVGAFCSDPAPYRHLVRFAFCKRDATLEEGLRRLQAVRTSIASWR
jgi:N-succinyldiaminopimelate aminotransferase